MIFIRISGKGLAKIDRINSMNFFTIKMREKNNYDSLLLAIGSYIWGSIVPCPIHLKSFVDENTVYTIIDVIEIASSPVRCLFLGLLTDICENIFCGHYLCTWRGIDKNKGLISLLAMIWREEESEIGVRKRLDGTIGGQSRRSIFNELFYTYNFLLFFSSFSFTQTLNYLSWVANNGSRHIVRD